MFFTGMIVGLLLGALVWEWRVALPAVDRAIDRERRLHERVQAWQRMYLFAVEQRVATSKAMYEALNDNDRHSVKAPPPPPVDIEPAVEFKTYPDLEVVR